MISIITISFGVIIFVVASICAFVSFLEREKRAASIFVARVLNAQICVRVRQFPSI